MLNQNNFLKIILLFLGFFVCFSVPTLFALRVGDKNYIEFKRNPKLDFSTDFVQKVNECNDRRSCGGIILPAGNFFLNKPLVINNGISITGSTEGKTTLTIGSKIKGFIFSSGSNPGNLVIKDLTINFNYANRKERVGAVNVRFPNTLVLENIDIINPPYIGINIVGSTTDKNVCTRVSLTNVKIVGTGTTTANGVNISGCSYLLLDRVDVNGAKKDGVFFDKVSSTTIINSNFVNNIGNALNFNSSDKILINNSTTSNSLSGIYLTGTTTDLVMTNILIQNNKKHGIFANSKSISELNISTNIISSNASTGLYISGGNKVMVASNHLKNNYENGLLITNSQNVTIDGNQIEANKNMGISLVKGANLIKIKNNNIIDTGFGNVIGDKFKSIAVSIATGTSDITLNNNFLNNSTSTVKTDFSLKVDSGAKSVTASNNIFASSTKDIDINTNTKKICVYDDPIMPFWRKIACLFSVNF